MSESSTNSSFSVVSAEETLGDLTINPADEFVNSSVVSEASAVNDLDRTIHEQTSPSLADDFSSFLTAQEKEELLQYPEEIASFIWPVYQSCSTWSAKFGKNKQFQNQIFSHGGGAYTWTLHYQGEIEGHLANLRVRYVGKEGSLQKRYEGDALEKWVPNFEGKEKMFEDMEPIYIYVYARIQAYPSEVTPWIKEMVFRQNYYKLGDFTVKLSDGGLNVSKSLLAEFFPFFRGFFVKYSEEKQISMEDFSIGGFKLAVEFMWTRKPFDFSKIGDELMDLASLLGAPAFMAEIDHQYTFWSKTCNFARNAFTASKIGLPVMKREMEKLTRLHWAQLYRDDKDFIMGNADFFLNLNLGPIMTGY